MKPYARADRVAEHIKRTLSGLLGRQIKDPRLSGAIISAVRITKDLRYAKVYYSVPGDETSRQAALEGFESARGFAKRALASELDLRFMPELQFVYDDSYDYGSRIEQLLASLKTEDGSDRSTPED